MPLSPGTRLGPYEITGPLGAGGMGEVYRARDTRLDRIVAIKILPGHLAVDPSLRARFEREARAVSALSHPHICTLHDIGEQGGVHFLVMEHIEGETLSSRLERGPLPPPEAMTMAAQIAGALAQAHRQGVVHRDLKPGNVMLTKAGAKLLDFGLAKRGADSAPPMSSAVMTKATPLTAEGTIVGTWQYMAPEQLEGAEADARSDIFAFGAMLFEMVTGRRAFEGRSQAGLIAAIMGSEPPVPSSLVPSSPPVLDRIVRRCLAKDPDDRWQSAADLASELKWIAEGSPSSGAASTIAPAGAAVGPDSGAAPSTPGAAPARKGRGERLAWVSVTVALVAALAALAARLFLQPPDPPRMMTSWLLPPAETRFDTRYAPAVSPDGRSVAFVVVGAEGKSRLWIQDVASGGTRELNDTDDAAFPFWAPDNRWVGFFSGDMLKKIDTGGGPAIALCEAQDGRGGSWSSEGVILFQPRFSDPLHKVAAGGGTPEKVTTLDEASFHVAHRWPHFLPDGRRFLFYVVATTNPGASEHSGIYLGSIDSPEIRKVVRVDSRMEYAQGHLLYKRGTTLMAQPFDPDRAELTGDPVPLGADVTGGVYSWGGAQFGVSAQGVLVYEGGAGQGETELAIFDRSGNRLGAVGDPDLYWDPRLSPDGRWAVMGIGKDASDLWLHDLDRDVRTRFTFDPADDTSPIWSPDGHQIAFGSSRKSIGELYRRDTSGTAQEEQLYSSETSLVPNDWSPDGRVILFTSLNRQTGFDLWTFSIDEKKAEPWVDGPLDQLSPRFSPDGRWVAYTSSESGRTEVFVQAFPQRDGGRWQVSRDGGFFPAWRRDGRELYYIMNDGNVMAVEVSTGAAFQVGTPRRLFRAPPKSSFGPNFDAAGDGKRFLVNMLAESDRSGEAATMVLNWTEALRR